MTDNIEQILKDDVFQIKTPHIRILGQIDKGHKLYLICIETSPDNVVGMYFPKEGVETMLKALTNAVNNQDLYNEKQKLDELEERERKYKEKSDMFRFSDSTKVAIGK